MEKLIKAENKFYYLSEKRPNKRSMDTKSGGLITTFTALATVLNFARIPVPYMPTFSYQLGDIVLLVAFLIFGIKIGLAISVANMIIKMFILASPAGIIGAPYYIVTMMTMVCGVYFFEKLVRPNIQIKKNETAKRTTLSTVFGVITRTIIMLPWITTFMDIWCL